MTSHDQLRAPALAIPEGNIGLDSVWWILRRNLWLIALIVCAVIGGTFVVVSSIEEVYRTRSTLVLTLHDTRVRTSDVQVESFQMTHSIVETELDILRSRVFAGEVVDAMGLQQNPIFAGPLDPTSDETPQELRERLIDKMLQSYSVFRDGDSLAIEIVASANDPQLAADISNKIAETYIVRSMLKRREGIRRTSAVLENRVVDLGEDLSQAELELAAFIRDHELDDDNLPDKLRADVDRLTAILDVIGSDEAEAAEIEVLGRDLAEAEAKLHDWTRSELTLLRMERALELLRARYQNAIERLNDLETQLQFSDQVSAQQVSVARVPVEPHSPNTRVALAVSGVAGLALAFVAALGIEGLNNRLWTDTQTSRISGLVNLGYLPHLRHRGLLRRRFDPLSMLSDYPHSAFAEALRAMLTIWSNFPGKGKVLMMASGLPNEGKSILSVSLAASAALDGMKVLVIDLDSHHRGAMRLVGIRQKSATIDQVLSGDVMPVPVTSSGKVFEGLHLLTLKTRSQYPMHVLKEKLGNLNAKLSADFDLIIVDTPPVLVVDDACRLGPLADKTVLVVRWGKTSEEVLRDAIARLHRAGIKTSGTIMNDVDLSKQRKYGYGGYAYRYGYGAADAH